jgi:hypothetical protein
MRHALLLAFAGPAQAPDQVDFARDVAPIFAERCVKCHAGDKPKSGFRLDVRRKALAGGNSGHAAIVPRDPAASLLLRMVRGEAEGPRMPPSGKALTEPQIASLERWIAEGAAWPDELAGEEAVREHWSFVAPVRPSLPRPQRAGWTANEIDAFTLATMEREGLLPAPPADRVTLLRRVALDLVGLPPTPDEVAAFVADEGEGAYERQVRRLLASPHFGERWARPWLDLARYADSSGYGSDPLRPYLWPWRDWVIDAFNRNLPFDRFTVLQLAGDLLPAEDEATRIEQTLATAFHRNTMTNTEGGTDDEEFRSAAVKDRVDTTMAAWMGLTFGCAKCHSHKFDPISQRDYYSLYAFFDQTEDADRDDEEPRLAAPTPAQRERRAELAARASRLAERAKAVRAGIPEPRFTRLPIASAVSLDGATLTIGADQVVRSGGMAPATDRTVIEGLARDLATLRLELLSEPMLPGGGPGRSPGNGNFVVNEARVLVRPAGATAPTARARHVRIDLPGRARILSLAEVEVVGADGAVLSRGRRATQSSTAFDGPPERAVDGVTDGRYESGSTTHTATENDPWWEVDLGAEREVARVVVSNRVGSGLEERLAGAIVTLLVDDAEPGAREGAGVRGGRRVATWQALLRAPPQPSTALEVADWREVPLSEARARYEQPGFAAAEAIDGDGSRDSGFAIGGEQGRDHALDLELRTPLGGPLEFRLEVDQSWGDSHVLGAFAVAGSADRPPAELAELSAEERALAAEQAALEAAVVRVPVLRELPPERRRTTRVLQKANHLLAGEEVAPATPRNFPPLPAGAPRDRLGLARWLVARDNPLTARVVVNRFWAGLFGRGLVETVEDFGTQGTPPSHPELLDWLAVTFMENGFDMKELLFTMVTSATYRQAAVAPSGARERDPENRWLSWFPRRRLDAEPLRDQALALSGLLTPTIGGPSVHPPQPDGLWQAAFNGERSYPTASGPDRYRRGLYTFWRRTVPPPAMQTFDAPSREACTLRRPATNTPLQAFVTLNDPCFVEAAQALARRIVEEGGDSFAARLQWGWRRVLLRAPTAEEAATVERLFDAELSRLVSDAGAARALCEKPLGPLPAGVDPAQTAAWVVVANVLLNLDAVLVRG